MLTLRVTSAKPGAGSPVLYYAIVSAATAPEPPPRGVAHMRQACARSPTLRQEMRTG